MKRPRCVAPSSARSSLTASAKMERNSFSTHFPVRLVKRLPAFLCLVQRSWSVLQHTLLLRSTTQDSTNGMKIGPDAGSCGSTAFHNREVLVEDISVDPRWSGFRDIALEHDLRACWSTPVVSSKGEVLATLAVYRNEVGRPSDAERDLVRSLAHTAATAIERSQTEAAIEKATRRKDEFLALLGHELRNPLAPIVTALEVMKLEEVGAKRERAAIERNVQHMIQLVDDLLDVSRIVRGKISLHLERIPVADVIREAAEIATPLLEEQNQRLQVRMCSDELAVCTDRTRVVQVFSNLLTNAAKYGEPEGTVVVEVEDGADGVTVSVTDTGVGIDSQLLPNVFEPFIQAAQDSSRSRGGVTGYGQKKDRVRSEKAGFEAHLVKPVQTSDLLAALQPKS